ncbi:OSBP(oxysterol binding protein)-related protein2A, partial [Striga asiatica]
SRLSAFDIGTSGNEVEKGVSACSVVAAVVCVSGFFDGPGSPGKPIFEDLDLYFLWQIPRLRFESSLFITEIGLVVIPGWRTQGPGLETNSSTQQFAFLERTSFEERSRATRIEGTENLHRDFAFWNLSVPVSSNSLIEKMEFGPSYDLCVPTKDKIYHRETGLSSQVVTAAFGV